MDGKPLAVGGATRQAAASHEQPLAAGGAGGVMADATSTARSTAGRCSRRVGRRRGRRAGLGGGGVLARQPAAASRAACGKKVIVIGIDGMDPRLCRAHDEGGPAAQPREAARSRRLQPAGHQHSAAKPRRLGQLHQRRRARVARHLRLHPSPSRTSSAHRSTRPRRRCPAKAAGKSATTSCSSISGRSITSRRRPCCGGRACRSGTISTRPAIPSTFYDLPSNYPPSPSQYGHHRCICGMGTPDMLGSYGTYQHFAENGPPRPSTKGAASDRG